MKIIEAKTNKEKQDAFSVRDQVFIEEQGVDPEVEHDSCDEHSIHIVGYLEEHPIAAGRVQVVADKGKIQRVAILKPYRNQGYGKQLMLAIEQILKKNNINSTYLNAQSHAVPFYQAIGFKVSSQPFYEAGIEHVTMNKRVN
ncbi:GNAT family N-acetyltransferase [Amphibacillus sp. Q70]|uniref:GNAT family N-acetyltransferase n=1 Tax=Amphibacillus sp. Q70 TaxID=3453416 RepID=UPI003F878225